MPEIRYWNPTLQTQQADKQRAIHPAQSNYQAFEAMMMDKLLSNSMGSEYSDIFSTNSSVDLLFGDISANTPDLQGKVKHIQDQGMGKVLAARLSNPLPNFGKSQSVDEKKAGMSSLNDMISLTMQEQMLKARKVLQDQAKAYESVTPLDSFNAANDGNQYQTIDEFIIFIKLQISIASGKLDLSEDQLRELL